MLAMKAPTQEEVDRIARELAPDVVRIRLNVWKDWSDDPALYFRVVLSDDVTTSRERFREATETVRRRVREALNLQESEYFPYFRFRILSEQLREELRAQDPSWT